MLRLRPTYEEILRESKTRRLRVLPGRERKTQQTILLDEVDFEDFDLDKYDKKTIIMNDNPFSNHSSYSSTSERLKTVIEPEKDAQQVESEHSMQSSKSNEKSEEQEEEQQKSFMRRLFDSLFEEVEVDMPLSRQPSSNNSEPLPTKKDETPIRSSSSSSISHHSNNPYDNLPIGGSRSSNSSSRSSTIHYGSSRPASTIRYGNSNPISVRSSPISVLSSPISVKSSPIVMSSASSSSSRS